MTYKKISMIDTNGFEVVEEVRAETITEAIETAPELFPDCTDFQEYHERRKDHGQI